MAGKKVGGIGGGLGGSVFGGDSPGDLGIKITADTSQLSGAIAEAGQQLSGFAKQLDGTSVGLGKMLEKSVQVKSNFASMKESIVKAADGFNEVKQALGGVIEVASGVVELAKFSAEMRQMEKSVPLHTLKMMQQAVGGSVDKVTLMKAAMRSMNGEFHLTERGMQTVLTAADNLADKFGGDTMEAFESLMKVIRTGSTKELANLGIAFEKTGDKTKDLSRLMTELGKIAAKPVDVDPALEAIERLEAGWHDFYISMKAWFGDLLIDAAKLATTAAAKVMSPAGDKMLQNKLWHVDHDRAIAMMREDYAKSGGRALSGDAEMEFSSKENEDYWMRRAASERGLAFQRQVTGQAGLTLANVARLRSQKMTEGKSTWQKDSKGPKDKLGIGDMDLLLNPTGALGGIGDELKGFMNDEPLDFSGFQRDFGALGGAFKEFGKGGKVQGFFGTDEQEQLEKFKQQIADTTSVVGASYSALSEGIAAGVEAAISGSNSIGQAALKASANALKAIAIESSVKALFSTAEGLFTGNPKAFAAAAQYAATAVAAGAGAALLGAAAGAMGGGGGAAAGGGGGATAGGGSSGGYSNYMETRDHRDNLLVPSGSRPVSNITINVNAGLVAEKQQVIDAINSGLVTARTSNTGAVRTDTSRAASYE